jgi:hypothetical protein
MWTRLASALSVVALLTVAASGAGQNGTSSGSPFAGTVTMIDSPAPAGSAQPAMTVDRSGRIWLSWLEARAEGGNRYRVASLQGSVWSEPITIAEGETLLANWADVPAIFVTSTGGLAASWLERGPERGRYGIRVRTSTDDGRTWTPTVTPHRDDAVAEHGFVAFFDAPGVGPGLVWLDGREMSRGQGNMSLRATTVAGGRPGEEMLVDDRVCDCCQTAAARIDGGVIVAYRDRSDDEIRDISVTRYVNGTWSAPSTVHADNWQINACPVNGPVIAASGRAVAVAWFTLDGREPLTKVAFSTDGGETFSPPARIDVDQTVGRLGIAMLDAERALVSSIERAGDDSHVVVREVRRNGRTSDIVRIAPIEPGRASGIPRMAVSGREVVFAWTDVSADGPSRVRVASARIK